VRIARALLLAGLGVILTGFLFVSLAGNGSGEPAELATVSASGLVVDPEPATSIQQTPAPSEGTSGLPTIALAALPEPARQTYLLILDDGPFPYPQDDQVFGNREGILPEREHGWYREYTVPIPGSSDRGARRFVVGEDGVFFYTDDHYATFHEVVE